MNAFWLLCVTLSLAVLFLGSALGALLANLAAWLMWRFGRAQLLRSPQLLFSIRLFPSAFGAILTAGFALPSFLLLEPTRSGLAQPVGPRHRDVQPLVGDLAVVGHDRDG